MSTTNKRKYVKKELAIEEEDGEVEIIDVVGVLKI
jgi:hypothetical protein